MNWRKCLLNHQQQPKGVKFSHQHQQLLLNHQEKERQTLIKKKVAENGKKSKKAEPEKIEEKKTKDKKERQKVKSELHLLFRLQKMEVLQSSIKFSMEMKKVKRLQVNPKSSIRQRKEFVDFM
jgi:hypothetical protein